MSRASDRIRRDWGLQRQRGLALVAVLWAGAALAAMAASLTTTARTQMMLARNVVEAAQAEALADGAVFRTLYVLILPDAARRPRTDGTVYRAQYDSGWTMVAIQNHAGLIDLNAAPQPLLAGLFRSVGVEAGAATMLADQIVRQRRPDAFRRVGGQSTGFDDRAARRPFDHVAQLRRMPGMRADLYERVAPSLTVLSGNAGIDPMTAPRRVLRALPRVSEDQADMIMAERDLLAGGAIASTPTVLGRQRSPREIELPAEVIAGGSLGASFTPVYTIRAVAKTKAGSQFVREATAQLTGIPEQPFAILGWERGIVQDDGLAPGNVARPPHLSF